MSSVGHLDDHSYVAIPTQTQSSMTSGWGWGIPFPVSYLDIFSSLPPQPLHMEVTLFDLGKCHSWHFGLTGPPTPPMNFGR